MPGNGDIKEVVSKNVCHTRLFAVWLFERFEKKKRQISRKMSQSIIDNCNFFVAQTRSDFRTRIIDSLYWLPYISLEVSMENLDAHPYNMFSDFALPWIGPQLNRKRNFFKVMLYCLFSCRETGS